MSSSGEKVPKIWCGKYHLFETDFKIVKTLLLLTGHWPGQNLTVRLLLYFYQVVTTVVLYSGQIYYISKQKKNFDELFSNFIWIIVITFTSIVSINNFYCKYDLKSTLELMNTEYQNTTGIERKIFDENFEQMKKIIRLGTAIYQLHFLYAISMPFLLLMLNDLNIIKVSEYFQISFQVLYDKKDRFWLKYIILVAHNTHSLPYVVGFFVLSFVGMSYVFSKVAIIQRGLENLTSDGYDTRTVTKRFKYYAMEHKKLIGFMQIANKYGFLLMISGFCILALVLCSTLLNIKVNFQHPEKLVSIITTLFIELVVVGILCFFGDEVCDINDKIKFSIYDSQWIYLSRKVKRSLNIMQYRCNTKLEVGVYGVLVLSVQIYAKCLRVAFTYFTFVCTLEQESRLK